MARFDAVLFDLDGTLIDTAPDFEFVLNQLLAEHQRDPLPFDLIRNTVSNGARALVTLGFGVDEGEPEFESLRNRLLEIYAAHLSVNSVLFPGMRELLDRLDEQSIRWGIVTNKPSQFAEPLIRDLELAQRCGSLICPDHVVQRKPHAEPILRACKEVGVGPERTLYVGDHVRDIESGRNAGAKTAAALYGYIVEEDDPQSWLADYYLQAADELMSIVF